MIMEQLNQRYLKSDDLESSGITWKSKTKKESEPAKAYASRSYEWLFDSSIRVNVLNNHIETKVDEVLKEPQKKIGSKLSVRLSRTKPSELKSQRSPLNSFLREVVACKIQKARS